jgi:hypothetical protein
MAELPLALSTQRVDRRRRHRAAEVAPDRCSVLPCETVTGEMNFAHRGGTGLR